MAKALSFKRSNSQVVTFDTVNNLISNLGPALTSVSTAVASMPGKAQDIVIIFRGDPYILVATTTNTIEVRKYDTGLSTWSTVSASYAPVGAGTQIPVCLQIVNETLVALWNEVGGTSPSTRVVKSTDGTTWSSVVNSSKVVTLLLTSVSGTITAGDLVTAGAASGQVLSYDSLTTTAVVLVTAGTFAPGALTDTTSGATATITTVTFTLSASAGGASIVWRKVVWFATSAGLRFYDPSANAFGTPDVGSDPSVQGPLVSSLLTQGSFSFWNNALYFVKPDVGSGIRLYRLNQSWALPAPTPPQWSLVPNVLGLATSGTMILGNDIGNYCLFVNKQDELCLWHSGPTVTKLVRTTAAAFPAFTDISLDKLPPELVTKVNLGITTYADSRHRLNELQWFLVKDSTGGGNSTTLCSWDGIGDIVVQQQFVDHDYLLPNGRQGESRTSTDIQPACHIVSVNTSTTSTTLATITVSGIVGTFNVNDAFSTTTPTASTGIIKSITNNIFTLQVNTGTVPASGILTDTVTLATATISSTPIISTAFPGRAVVTYVIRDSLSRSCDVLGEYSIDGDQWFPMTKGGGDDGGKGLSSSSTGVIHTFFWDAFADLDGSFTFLNVRMIAKLAVSAEEAPPNTFVAIVQEDYLRPPVNRGVSNIQISMGTLVRAYSPNEQITGSTSAATGLVQTSIVTKTFSGGVGSFVVGNTFSAVSSPAGQSATGRIISVSGPVATPTLVLDVQAVTGYFPITGTITDTGSSATATIVGSPSANDVTLTSVTGSFTFLETVTGSISGATGLVNKKRLKLLVNNTSGIIAPGNTISVGVNSGTIISVTLPSVIVDLTTGSFSAGNSFTTTGPGAGKISSVDFSAVTAILTPADETTDLEEFLQVSSISNRGRCSAVFQGRLSNNQTRIRFLKLTVRGTGSTPKLKLSVFVSGQGPSNQYTGSFSSLTTLPIGDTEVIISNLDLLNQPSLTGKRYSVVADFDLNNNDSGVISTPFYRQE